MNKHFLLAMQTAWGLFSNEIIHIQDTLIIEQRQILAQFELAAAPSQLPIIVHNNFVPIVITNNTGLSADQVYATFQGLNPANPVAQQFLSFDPSSAMGSFVVPANNLFSPNYSYPLSSMPQVTGMPGSYLFYVPLITSGRLTITLNQPFYVGTTNVSPYGVQDPFVTQYTDPNYYTIYDKWEFTFSTTGNSAPNLAWQGNVNTSGVDFFGLSSKLQFLSYPSNQLLQTFDSTQVNDGPTSFNQSRDTLLSTFVTGLTTANNSAYWSSLILPFLTNPYSAATPGNTTTYLRILNPGFSIQNPPSSYGGAVAFPQNPSAGFPSDYLSNSAAYGENYIDNWFSYYNGTGNSLTIDQDVLGAPYTYSGNSSGASPNQSFLLTSSGYPNATLAQNLTSTTPFFTGTGFPFSPANSILSEYIGGTFEAGLFNVMTVPTISQANLRAESANYYSNPPFMMTAGPWYDLYAKLLHSEGLIPSYSVTNVGAVYASPYDDLLGINSSIAIKNPTNYQTVPNPYVSITLNPVNTQTIPSIVDTTPTTVQFIFNTPGSTLKYRTGGTGDYISVATMATVPVNNFPLQVEYVSGNYPGTSRYYTIYLTYQNIQPTIGPTTVFNTDDAGILNTATIYPNAGFTTYTVTFAQ